MIYLKEKYPHKKPIGYWIYGENVILNTSPSLGLGYSEVCQYIELADGKIQPTNPVRSEDVFDIINAQILLELNGKAQIDDEITLIKLLKTREGLKKYKENLEELVQTLAKENLSAIAENSGLDEETCSQFFGLSQTQAV